MSPEEILEEVQAMQKSNPELSYDECFSAIECRRSARPGDVRAAVLEIQAQTAGMTWEEA